MEIKDVVLEVYDNDISAEQIAHTKYVNSLTPEGLASAAMKDIDPDFSKKLERGKIMVAGRNFGCNSSREWAPRSLYHAGVKLVIAESYARIFFRNAINFGLPILECKEIRQIAKTGDELEVNLSTGEIVNKTTGQKVNGTILPSFLLNIMTSGGLLKALEAERQGKNEDTKN
jgi:3-isopropylmalate/(R)-2-methylmalate dehydratase small subunit